MREVKLYYGPYESNGLIRHKPQKLHGVIDRLKNMGYDVELIPISCLERVLVKIKGYVVGIARRKEKLEELKSNLGGKKENFYYFVGNIAKEEDVVAAFQWIKEHIGVVNILINNAGIVRPSSLIKANSEHIKEILNTNVFGLCIATREALKEMQDNQIDGHVIHINSVLGHTVIRGDTFNVYPASKYAVTALTETLRNELSLANSKIKVSSISPGLVRTEIFEAALKANKPTQGTDGSELYANKDHIKNEPFLNAKDIADAVVFVLSTPSHVQIHELIIKPLGGKY